MRKIRKKDRRGSIYVVTMSSCMIVAVLGLTALTNVRIQRLQHTDALNIRQALSYAEAALEMAEYHAKSTSDWRTKMASQSFATDRAVGDGYYSYVGVDPIDADLTDSAYDPVLITATGKKGNSVQKLAKRLEVAQPALTCLSTGMHAFEDIIIENGTVTSHFASISSGTKIVAKDCTIHAHCESGTTVDTTNAVINGTKYQYVAAKQMPNETTLINNYVANGTTIPITSLPQWNRNYLSNPGAESGVTGWTAQNCTVVQSATQLYGGTSSFAISNRNILPLTFPSFIYQDITGELAQNVSYDLQARVYVDGALNADSFRIRLQINATGGNTSYATAWTPVPSGAWTLVSGTGSVTWSGTLQSAYWYVESQLLAAPYYLDDCLMKETGSDTTYVIHRKVLSPQSNPFTGVTNSQGIYVINCGGGRISIRDSRIVGTIVLRTPAATSLIDGSIQWQPAVSNSVDPATPNLVALIMDKKMKIALSATPLSERITNRNLNPVGAPSNGQTDSDLSDDYSSAIDGVIYSVEELTLGGSTTVNGTIISKRKIEIYGASDVITINHNALYRFVNPPLEFRGTPVYSFVNGSATRVVD